ncbi:hypothetical protein RCL1_001464 [Eukaryota sp. TZLM3-RCL]
MKIFHDPTTGFTLDYSSFKPLSCLDTIQSRYSHAIDRILDVIQRTEDGQVVNSTSVKSESENRRVDHYNHRIKTPRGNDDFATRSLQSSLDYNEKVKSDVATIINGGTTKEGQRFTDVVFNGIGGSFLGPLMLIVSQRGDNYNDGLPLRLHFVSNSDPDSFNVLLSHVQLESTLCVHMSKSGSTAETAGNLEAFVSLLKQRGLDYGSRNCAITTPNSPFDKTAQKQQFRFIWYMLEETGGRTSIVSAIGMVPAAFALMDFGAFLRGQSDMDDLTRKSALSENPALLIALGIDYSSLLNGRKNMIVLGYSDFLKEWSHYLQQLYMESLGKEYDIDGVPSPYGLSTFGGVVQQVQKGIDDAFVRFVSFRRRSHDFANAKAGSMGRQLLGFLKGTQSALTKNGRDWMSIVLEQRNEYAMGLLVALEERIVSCLAALKRINAYDQPDGKLAANDFNRISAKIVQVLASGKFQTGSAADFVEAHGEFVGSKCLATVSAVLEDVSGNLKVANAYPELSQVKSIDRQWIDGDFVYSLVL